MLLIWLDLPFGVSAALELYQRKQHKLLAGLKGIADDFLREGCGDTEEESIHNHVANLIPSAWKKLQFCVRKVHFHGHFSSAEGLKVRC